MIVHDPLLGREVVVDDRRAGRRIASVTPGSAFALVETTFGLGSLSDSPARATKRAVPTEQNIPTIMPTI
ncbi:MAG TPA: hypothetical protein VLQ80_14450, partial [Candidatus Saccharimonadia bacterium]|nr:hypothetical protein [Candidatus Saccharimonadia bacterium]